MSYVTLSSKKVLEACTDFLNWIHDERKSRIGILVEKYIKQHPKRIGFFKRDVYTYEEAEKRIKNDVNWHLAYHEAYTLGYSSSEITRIKNLAVAASLSDTVSVSVDDLVFIYKFIKKD